MRYVQLVKIDRDVKVHELDMGQLYELADGRLMQVVKDKVYNIHAKGNWARVEDSISRPKKTKKKVHTYPHFARPMQVSTSLQEIIKGDKLSRTEVVKRFWAYIRENDLQCKKNKRNILVGSDPKLRVIFGNKIQVSMFELTKYISQHLKEIR